MRPVGHEVTRSRTAVAVGLGAGGHARSVIDALGGDPGVRVVGLLDRDAERVGDRFSGVEILGDDHWLASARRSGITHFFVGVGSVGDPGTRQRLFEIGRHWGLVPLVVVHPSATVSREATLAPGTVVLAGAIVNAGAHVAENAIVNTGAIVEHDCRIAAHAHVATGARLAGGVSVGEGSLVGIGSIVRQGIEIGRRAVVGAGAVVVSDVPDWTRVVGVPARRLE